MFLRGAVQRYGLQHGGWKTTFIKNYQDVVRAAPHDIQTHIIQQEHETVYSSGKYGDFTDLSKQGQDALIRIIGTLPPAERETIIDFGCGTGKLLAILNDKFLFYRVVGIDFSVTLIQKARAARPSHFELFYADFVNYQYNRESFFDIGLSVHSLEHCLDPKKAVDVMMERVHRLIIVTPLYGIAETNGVVELPDGSLYGDLHLHDLGHPDKLKPYINRYENIGNITTDMELITVIKKRDNKP